MYHHETKIISTPEIQNNRDLDNPTVQDGRPVPTDIDTVYLNRVLDDLEALRQ